MAANPSKDTGTEAETAVLRWLLANGFPGARRNPLHGNRDQGDIWAASGLVIEVKAGHTAEKSEPADVTEWMRQTQVERENADADFAILVTKRAGRGTARVGDWWAWITAGELVMLAIAAEDIAQAAAGTIHAGPRTSAPQWAVPIRMRLADLAPIIRLAGYGDPIQPIIPKEPTCSPA